MIFYPQEGNKFGCQSDKYRYTVHISPHCNKLRGNKSARIIDGFTQQHLNYVIHENFEKLKELGFFAIIFSQNPFSSKKHYVVVEIKPHGKYFDINGQLFVIVKTMLTDDGLFNLKGIPFSRRIYHSETFEEILANERFEKIKDVLLPITFKTEDDEEKVTTNPVNPPELPSFTVVHEDNVESTTSRNNIRIISKKQTVKAVKQKTRQLKVLTNKKTVVLNIVSKFNKKVR